MLDQNVRNPAPYPTRKAGPGQPEDLVDSYEEGNRWCNCSAPYRYALTANGHWLMMECTSCGNWCLPSNPTRTRHRPTSTPAAS